MTEKEMRESKVPWPKTQKELNEYISELAKHGNDYGTAVYAMSMAAVAAFYYMSHKVGSSGFQASCAEMDFVQRTRHLKHGFRLIDYEKLLYPQYLNAEHFPTHQELLEDNKEHLSVAAKQLLEKSPEASSNVLKRWQYVAGLSDETV